LDKSELDSYLANAFCLVYPTLNEGFGYPPLQAMHFGVPSLCSAIASTTEVLKDSVLYFNPYSISEIQNRILQISNDNDIRETIRKKIKLRINELAHIQEQHEIDFYDVLFKR